YLSLGSFFFFQAEDGIRDRTVTGVQTCALPILILVWAPTLAFLKFDTWQLLINTATTIVTFLLVALLQNSQTRNDQATQHKLNEIGRASCRERVYVQVGDVLQEKNRTQK